MGDTPGTVSDSSVALAATFASETRTAQLAIVRGNWVDEVYDTEPVDVYAVQKGLVSVMFGIAEDRGLLHLDTPVSEVLGTGWTQLPSRTESSVRISNVLDMTTGMDDELRPLGEVGVTWRYNNIAYNYLKTVLEIVTGLSLSEMTRAWLTGPLDMGSTAWVERPVLRPDGRPITGLASTAADLARFGAMILHGGDGIAPNDYLRSVARPGSAENPSWGLCWWNNDQTHHRLPRREADIRPGPITPEAPPDTITARGALENYLFVVPSLDLVVARTARPLETRQRPDRFDGPFWRLLTGTTN